MNANTQAIRDAEAEWDRRANTSDQFWEWMGQALVDASNQEIALAISDYDNESISKAFRENDAIEFLRLARRAFHLSKIDECSLLAEDQS